MDSGALQLPRAPARARRWLAAVSAAPATLPTFGLRATLVPQPARRATGQTNTSASPPPLLCTIAHGPRGAGAARAALLRVWLHAPQGAARTRHGRHNLAHLQLVQDGRLAGIVEAEDEDAELLVTQQGGEQLGDEDPLRVCAGARQPQSGARAHRRRPCSARCGLYHWRSLGFLGSAAGSRLRGRRGRNS
eukprot:1843210-Prymnesium_polylepis.1